MDKQYNQGLELLNTGEYSESIKYFNKVLDIDPDNIIDANYQKSKALGIIGEYSEQLDALETILKLDPENKNALMSLASYYNDFAQYDKELEILEQLISNYPDDPKALLNKALCLTNINKEIRVEDFEKIFSFISSAEDTETILNIKGFLEFIFGEYDVAINYFKKSLEIRKNIDNYFQIANIYSDIENLDKSRIYLNKCLEINPNYIPALLLYSALENDKNVQESEFYIDKILSINPNHFTALVCKAWLILDDEIPNLSWKDFKKAETYIDRALKLIPNDPEMLKIKAICLSVSGKPDESCEYYKKALSINPNDEEIYTGAAITLVSKNNYQKALDYCEKAKELNPDYTFPLYYKGEIMNYMGEYTKALEYFDQYLQLEKNDISALLSKSESLIYLKNYNEALNIVEEAIYLDPIRIGSWITKGKIYHYYLNDLSEAVKIYKYALENVEEDPELYYYLKNALKSLGNLEESRYYENRLIKSDIIALEKQLEDKLVKDLSVFKKCGFDLKLLKRQCQCKNSDGDRRRIDLLCKDSKGKTVIVELKVVMASIETYNQIKEYIEIMNSDKKEVIGIIVSDGADDELIEKINQDERILQFNITDLGFETMF